MALAPLDWILIGFFFLLTLTVGIFLSGRAGKNISEFFLSGRKLPWYVAGVSMVATTFAADTPLAITEIVTTDGIAGNWLWWNFLIGGMLTTFFFARLWRRANILTEVELIEFRYSGPPAKFLRVFRSLYLGLFINVLIMGWVNLAFMSLLEVFFGVPDHQQVYYVSGAMLLIAAYSSLAGLWGVAINDFLQFFIALIGSIMLAYFVLSSEQVGGITGLKEQVPSDTLQFFPDISWHADPSAIGKSLTLGLGSFLAYIGVIWWSSWYPGNEPGGGGYIAQRMMSTKDESHAIKATLFFQIAHYCIRPWPWILVGLGTIVLYPELGEEEKRLGYVMAMRDFLPAGWKGLMLVAFISAYMSTISTQLNWGASYLMNDFYKRFMHRTMDDKTMVLSSRIITLLLAAIAVYVAMQFETISGVWKFVLECGAGLGLLLILRWYWWRINVWGEITASIAPFVFYYLANYPLGMSFPNSFFLTVGATIFSWVLVMFLTPPEDDETLKAFYHRIQPGGAWEPIRKKLDLPKPKANLGVLAVCWLSAVVLIYSILFLMGKIIFLEWPAALPWAGVCVVSFIIFRWGVKRTRILQ